MLPLRLAAALVPAAALLTACGTSDEEHRRRLDAACQDNRTRAYAAAGRAAVGGEVTQAEALHSMRTYVDEVRTTPVCFARPLREEVEQAAEEAERGRLLPLQHPQGGA